MITLSQKIRQVEEETVLIQALPRLHRDRAIESGGGEQRRKIRRQEVAADRPSGFHPRILFGVVAPKMVVAVEAGLTALRRADLHHVALPNNCSDTVLRDLLAPLAAARLLHFTTVLEAFSRFEDEGAQRRFLDRLNHVPGFWCCKKVPKGEDAGRPYKLLPQTDTPR